MKHLHEAQFTTSTDKEEDTRNFTDAINDADLTAFSQTVRRTRRGQERTRA